MPPAPTTFLQAATPVVMAVANPFAIVLVRPAGQVATTDAPAVAVGAFAVLASLVGLGLGAYVGYQSVRHWGAK